MGCRWREFGRIQDDGVKCATFLVKAAQAAVDIGIEKFGLRRVKAVQAHMGLGALDGRPRRVNRGDLPAPPQAAAGTHARQRCDGKTTGVAIAVEHALETQAARVIGKFLAAVALVQVKTGFVTLRNVQRESPVVLLDRQFGAFRVRGATTQPASGRRQALERTHPRIRAFIKPRATDLGQQGVGQHRFPALGAAGEELCHQGVGIAVHNQARQAIGLAVNQAHAVALDIKTLAGGDRLGNGALKEGCLNALGFVKTPDSGSDFGGGAEGSPAQKLAAVRLHPHGFTRIATALGDGAVKNPGVPAQRRTFFPRLQFQCLHREDCPSLTFCGPGGARRRRPWPDAGNPAGCRPGWC